MSHDHSAQPASPVVQVGQHDDFINLQSYIDIDRSQVLNVDASTTLKSILGVTPGILRSDSDVDSELILVINFRESIKLRGMKFLATESKSNSDLDASGPSTVKIFLNRPNYSFSECSSEVPTETLQLNMNQLKGEEEIKVKFVHFQNVNSITIFISSNQGDEPITFLNQLQFIGTVVSGTNMKNLKAISCDC